LQEWFDNTKKESVIMQSMREMQSGGTYFADVPAMQFLWGIIPVEYTMNGVKIRRIFHVLKTIPAPGFDLMRCLVDLQRKGTNFHFMLKFS
jgi:hypothetical protein